MVSTGSLLSEAVSRCYILIPYCQHPTKNRDLYCYFDAHTGVGKHKVEEDEGEEGEEAGEEEGEEEAAEEET